MTLKKATPLILCSFYLIVLLSSSLSWSQKIDWINAPKNPIGFKWQTNHFNLKGDIYASGDKLFNRKGFLTENISTIYYYEKGVLVGTNYGDIIKTDARGNIVEYTYKKGSRTSYTFSANNLLIKEEDSNGNLKIHEYDTRDRIISTLWHKKNQIYQKREYQYEKKGDTTIVNVAYTFNNSDLKNFYHYYYVNGHLVKELSPSGTFNYQVTLDQKGNPIDFYNTDKADATHFKTYNRYFDDANKQNKIEFGYYRYSNSSKPVPAVFFNGVRATDIKISDGVKDNEKVVYDGLNNIYYSVTEFSEQDKSTDKRIPVTQIISKDLRNITYSHNGKFIAYVNGDNKVKHREFCYLGPHLIDYRQDQSEGRTYMVLNYREKKEDAVKPLKLISDNNTSIFYTRDLVKDNFFVAHNGKHIDYKNARFEYLDNGDPVIFINDTPKFVLTGFKDASNFVVQEGKPYDNELPTNPDSTNTSNTTTTPSSSTNYTCKKGDCKNGWGQTNINGIVVDGTFKNGALDGLAYISYPNDAYYHGEYKNNFREGMGYYKFDSGNAYVGYWKDGKQHGFGMTFDKNGQITSAGEFENGKLVKDMSIDYRTNKNSSSYCQGNCSDGFGKYTYGNGDTYLGFFKNNQRYSVGTYNWTNNSKFTGAYTLGGTRSGYGMYTYVDQSVFKGFFINDKIDGLGVMKYSKSGSIVYGVFNNKGTKIKDY